MRQILETLNGASLNNLRSFNESARQCSNNVTDRWRDSTRPLIANFYFYSILRFCSILHIFQYFTFVEISQHLFCHYQSAFLSIWPFPITAASSTSCKTIVCPALPAFFSIFAVFFLFFSILPLWRIHFAVFLPSTSQYHISGNNRRTPARWRR